MQDFSDTRTWVFDLDNTLYHPSARLFDQIEVKMEAWIIDRIGVSQAEAKQLRKDYWAKHGTTLMLITHDPSLAQRCRRQLAIGDGRISSDRMTS